MLLQSDQLREGDTNNNMDRRDFCFDGSSTKKDLRMQIPRAMVPQVVTQVSYDMDQSELRLEALEEVQKMDGHSFVIYFDADMTYEIVCVDGNWAFEYNPLTDIYIQG